MPKNILITGMPRSGKSTLINKVISDIKNKVGFVTNEIREQGERTGFEVETHSRGKQLLSSKKINTPYKVSSYSVDLENFESILPEVENFQPNDFLYLDEIGEMELFSDKFKELTLKYLDSENTCLAGISKIYSDEFTEQIKNRSDVTIFEITEENREEVYNKVIKELESNY